jgi:hypothetical protein
MLITESLQVAILFEEFAPLTRQFITPRSVVDMVDAVLITVDQINLLAHRAHIPQIAPPAHFALIERHVLQRHACGILPHRSLLDILETPGSIAQFASAQIAEDEAMLAMLINDDFDNLNASAWTWHADQVHPRFGQFLAGYAGIFLDLVPLFAAHHQIEIDIALCISSDAPDSAASTPAWSSVAPGRLIVTWLFKLIQIARRCIIAE